MKTNYFSKQMKDFMQASLLAVSLLCAHSAIAGERGGNGGDGITIDGKLYVLDLVEAGVEQDPHFGDGTGIIPSVLRKLTAHLGNEYFPIEKIATKLADIEAIDPVMARIILRGIELYNWRLVSSSLVNVRDENTLLDYENLSQLAIRRNGTIMINRNLWQQLDDANKVALVLHEVLYALVKPETTSDGIEQDSVTARELTGYLFTNDLARLGIEGLQRFVGTKFNFTVHNLWYKKVVAHDNGILSSPALIAYYSGGPREGVSIEREYPNPADDLSLQQIGRMSCDAVNPLTSRISWNNISIAYRYNRSKVELVQASGQTFLRVTDSVYESERGETVNRSRGEGSCVDRVNRFALHHLEELEDYFTRSNQ
jgi:hypothetical protein